MYRFMLSLFRYNKDYPVSLEVFAQRYAMRGEKLVCCEMRSRLSDEFYGQWLVLNVPFRSLEEFNDDRIAERVPQQHQNFAMAMCCRSPQASTFWSSEECIREEMRKEIDKPIRIHCACAFVL